MFVFPAFDFDHEAAVHPRLLDSRSLKAEREGCIIFFSFILMDPVSEDFHWKNRSSQTPIKKNLENNCVLEFDTSGLIDNIDMYGYISGTS
jgi:hypothetical protein